MNKISKILTIPTLLALTSCSTLENSLRLGSALGTGTAVITTHAAFNSTDQKPSSNQLSSAAGIGMAVGLISSYLIYKNTEKEKLMTPQLSPEIHFGDLPPNPFDNSQYTNQ